MADTLPSLHASAATDTWQRPLSLAQGTRLPVANTSARDTTTFGHMLAGSAASEVVPSAFKLVPSFKDIGFQLQTAILNQFEKSAQAFSHVLFLQDTFTNLMPKWLNARSFVDFFEMNFTELLESGIFYYVPAVFGDFVYGPISRVGKNLQTTAKQLHQQEMANAQRAGEEFIQSEPRDALKYSLSLIKQAAEEGRITEDAKNALLAAKAAVVGAATMTALTAEYGLNFVKNLVTESGFHLHKFSDVLGYTEIGTDDVGDSPVADKARKRLLQLGTIMGGTLLAAGAVAFGGWRLKPVQQGMEKFLRLYDFDVSKGAFGIDTPHLVTIVGIGGFGGYVDAARDALERGEIVLRLMWSVPMTAMGNQWLSNKMLSHLMKDHWDDVKDIVVKATPKNPEGVLERFFTWMQDLKVATGPDGERYSGLKSLDKLRRQAMRKAGEVTGLDDLAQAILDEAHRLDNIVSDRVKRNAAEYRHIPLDSEKRFNYVIEQLKKAKPELEPQLRHLGEEMATIIKPWRAAKHFHLFMPLVLAIGTSLVYMRILNFMITPFRFKRQQQQAHLAEGQQLANQQVHIPGILPSVPAKSAISNPQQLNKPATDKALPLPGLRDDSHPAAVTFQEAIQPVLVQPALLQPAGQPVQSPFTLPPQQLPARL